MTPLRFPLVPLTRRALLALAAASGGALAQAPRVEGPPAAFEAWADSLAAEWVRLSPEGATSSQYFNGAEQDALDRQLTPQTVAQRQLRRDLAARGLDRLKAFEAAGLSAGQRVEAATIRWSLRRTLDGEPFEDHSFAFNQIRGVQVSVVSFLTQTHPLRRPADVASYLDRLGQVALRVDEALSRARSAAARGLLPPRFILDRSRAQVQAFLAAAPGQNLFVVALAERTAGVAGFAEADRQRAIDEATRTVEEKVRPAWMRVQALFDDIQPRTTQDAGLWRLPDGVAAYTQALSANTTTDLGGRRDSCHRAA